MIRVQNLVLRFGERAIFNNISFTVTPGEKLAITGRNGSGKSTLLKVLSEAIKPDEGLVEKPKDVKVGYLEQELPADKGFTVREEIMSSLVEINALHEELKHCEDQLSNPNLEEKKLMYYIELMEDIHHRMDYMNADKIEGEIEKILIGLGFKSTDFERKTHEFSGGWRMRLELAKLLLSRPNVMLLDEPNNHLDILSIQWLEKYLLTYEGSVILISHDLMFVDRIAKRIIEVDRGKLYDFVGSYSAFIDYKKERRDIELSEFKSQQKLIQHKEVLIDKFRAKASKASFAKSLQSELARMDVIEAPDEEQSSIRLRFQPSHPGGRMVIEARELTKSYGDLMVLNNIEFFIERGEKLSFIGQNGQGKSTLVKLISQVEPPTHGVINLGHQVKIGYFAQEHTELMDPNQTILEVVESVSLPAVRPLIRNILGGLAFGGDDVEKRIRVLSGGEKSRVRLASLLVQEHNFLILDEPTHHLDISSKESLKEAIKNYKGTVIVVSHDREFLRGLAEKTCFFADQKVRIFEGDIDYFLEKTNTESLLQSFEKSNNTATAAAVKQPEPAPNIDPEEKKKAAKKIGILEKDIERLETKKKELETQMGVPGFFEQSNSGTILKEYELLKSQIATHVKEWEQLVEMV